MRCLPPQIAVNSLVDWLVGILIDVFFNMLGRLSTAFVCILSIGTYTRYI